MAEIKEAKAIVQTDIYVHCPHCDLRQDLSQKTKYWTLWVCHKCGKEFRILGLKGGE